LERSEARIKVFPKIAALCVDLEKNKKRKEGGLWFATSDNEEVD
jgi:hypothetical protein